MREITRLTRILLVGVVAACGFLVARQAGAWFGSSELVSRPNIQDMMFQVTNVLPPMQTYDDAGNAEPMREFLSDSAPTVFAFFSTGCSKCYAEAGVWEQLASESQRRVRFVGLAATSSVEEMKAFVAHAGISFPVLRVDPAAVKSLRIPVYPSFYAVDGHSHVLFRATGDGGTEDLVSWVGSRSSVDHSNL